ncbi:hypothetical protein [[Flexibacter] sp. ATCC 35208]|uniref:hypothetical protein n=1 Tax=[Flexibacter] sp. ATCC 35208 TaxID=1936242 RepID=UPI0009CC93DB|nr:hypothetical protein [[Flexibacter] sp. ATCC 35208]OMP75156.1 hypothetical protein BW716_31650 [[Flexibacter] sp. ATCC 35208]
MKEWSIIPLKWNDIFILILFATSCLLAGWILTMIHILKVKPEKLILYRKIRVVRYFVNSEIARAARDKEYIIRGSGAGIVLLFIGIIAMICCLNSLLVHLNDIFRLK